jgi:hypothetical protein
MNPSSTNPISKCAMAGRDADFYLHTITEATPNPSFHGIPNPGNRGGHIHPN